jgi:hypothetical protein
MKVELNITRDEFEKAKLILVSIDSYSSRNGITGFNVYLLFSDCSLKKVIGGTYWNEKYGNHHCTGWGVDRALVIVESIRNLLGVEKFDQSKIKKLF